MNYQLIPSIEPQKNSCLVVGVFDDAPVSPEVAQLDQQMGGIIHRLKERSHKTGTFRIQSETDSKTQMSLVVIYCGTRTNHRLEHQSKYIHACMKTLLSLECSHLLFALPLIEEQDANHQLEQMILTLEAATYTQPPFKTSVPNPTIQSISIFLPHTTQEALQNGLMIAKGIHLTKTLADLPANVCTPSYLGHQAETMAKNFDTLTCRLHHQKELEALNMGGILAVAKGSIEPPCLIELSYQGTDATTAPIVLVGKGVTFDAGGISLKPGPFMNEMKYDMAGAATVLGTIQACAELKLPIRLIGLMPCVENLPSGHAVKPGDIITMMSKQSVEVLNTDAEGRLILADALTYAERFNPAFVIDIATLTGAMVVALGHVASGLMTPHDSLATAIQTAAEKTLDKVWRMPMFEAYAEGLESPIADMINTGFDRAAGGVLAGMFLAAFTKNYTWAHLDIAGTAWISGDKRVATGRPVALLVEWLRHAHQTH